MAFITLVTEMPPYGRYRCLSAGGVKREYEFAEKYSVGFHTGTIGKPMEKEEMGTRPRGSGSYEADTIPGTKGNVSEVDEVGYDIILADNGLKGILSTEIMEQHQMLRFFLKAEAISENVL